MCVRERSCRPCGTRSELPLLPALPCWAFTYRRFAAGVLRFYSAGFPGALKPPVRSELARSVIYYDSWATRHYGPRTTSRPSFRADCRNLGLRREVKGPTLTSKSAALGWGTLLFNLLFD